MIAFNLFHLIPLFCVLVMVLEVWTFVLKARQAEKEASRG